MARPEFRKLPFYKRPDLTPYFVHFTRSTYAEDGYSAFKNLVSILKTGEIWASHRKHGFVKGSQGATCFMDVPFVALKYICDLARRLQPADAQPARSASRHRVYYFVILTAMIYISFRHLRAYQAIADCGGRHVWGAQAATRGGATTPAPSFDN